MEITLSLNLPYILRIFYMCTKSHKFLSVLLRKRTVLFLRRSEVENLARQDIHFVNLDVSGPRTFVSSVSCDRDAGSETL